MSQARLILTGASNQHLTWMTMSWLELVAGVTAAITGSVAVLSSVRHLYRRTVGRRRQLAARINQLGPGMYLGLFEQLLGVPNQRRAAPGSESVTWIRDAAIVHVDAGRDMHVKVMSVTTRSRRFNPTFATGATVSLGKTRFSQLPSRPDWIRGSLGARRFNYAEGYYFGNPGFYRWYVYSLNDAGYAASDVWGVIRLAERRGGSLAIDDDDVSAFLDDVDTQGARSTSVINTITISDVAVPLDPKDAPFGPDLDTIRVVPDSHGSNTGARMWWLRFKRAGRRL